MSGREGLEMRNGFGDGVALVMGGATGIGMEIAKAFARRGATVVIADSREHDEKRVVDAIRKEGGHGAFHPCDVTQSYQVRNVIELIRENYGRLDFACNDAGMESPSAPLGESDENAWERILDVNLTGVYLCMKHEISAMELSGGAIVNIASTAGLVGFPGMAAYSAAKHGVIGLTKTAALEYAGRRIRVNAVCPGMINSPWLERFTGKEPQRLAALAAEQPMGRLGTTVEVAEAAVWLCSPASAYVTGQALAVDGGWTAR
jgi:NAD(P)-dependent dehydrogenase (short-subunit alcohol dehydrogenase family)